MNRGLTTLYGTRHVMETGHQQFNKEKTRNSETKLTFLTHWVRHLATNASPLTAVTVHCTAHNRAHTLPKARMFSLPDHNTCRYTAVLRSDASPTTRYHAAPPTAGQKQSPRPLPPHPAQSPPHSATVPAAARRERTGRGDLRWGGGGEGRRHQRLVLWSPGGGCVCVQSGLAGGVPVLTLIGGLITAAVGACPALGVRYIGSSLR